MDVALVDNVFINCPFDSDYMPVFRGIVFTVYACGFLPICALDEDDASEFRLNKIVRLIGECRCGIHDISNTDIDASSGLPRFNMPFELGIFYGAKKSGSEDQRRKSMLILERRKYSYQKYISDLGGIDTRAHEGNTERLIRIVRDWLNYATQRRVPGHTTISRQHADFFQKLPTFCAMGGVEYDNISHRDLCTYIESYLNEDPLPPIARSIA